jgi:hypothetical protein
MSRDQFEDLVRKVKLALAPRLRTSASGAALLDEAFQVGRYFILLHIITHYLHWHVSIMNPGMIYTCLAQEAVADGVNAVLPEHSPHYQLQQENNPEPTVRDSSASGAGTNPVHYPLGSVSSLPINSKGEEIIYPVEVSKTTGIGYGPGTWSGLSISTWTGQRTNRTSFNATLRPSCVSPSKHVKGNMIRSTFLILTSNLIRHAGPYGHCGGDNSVD